MEPNASPAVDDLARWCAGRAPGRDARRRRVPRLIDEFADLVRGPSLVVNVTGTCGKGSTCALLDAALTAAGHTTGRFTSPHLVGFAERIRVEGRPVSASTLDRHIAEVTPRLRRFVARHGEAFRPALFEALMIVAFSIDGESAVTAAIFEAAIGGSNDATCFLPAHLSIVTSVGLDHTGELGTTIEAIAADKSGIARDGGVLLLGAGIPAAAAAAARDEAAGRGVRVVSTPEPAIEVRSSNLEGQDVVLRPGGRREHVHLPLAGDHQLLNLATVAEALRLLEESGRVESAGCITGVADATIPGRIEHVAGRPSWLLDVAHNPDSIEALIRTIRTHRSLDDAVFLIGATEPHDYRTFVSRISATAARVAFCEGFNRAVAVAALAGAVTAPTSVVGSFATPGEALDRLSAAEFADALVVITGSLFLVGRCRLELEDRGILAGGW